MLLLTGLCARRWIRAVGGIPAAVLMMQSAASVRFIINVCRRRGQQNTGTRFSIFDNGVRCVTYMLHNVVTNCGAAGRKHYNSVKNAR